MKKLFMETTAISVERTIAQIQTTLSAYGIEAMLTEYKAGKVEDISFKMKGLPFKLPCRWRAVAAIMNKRRGLAHDSMVVEDRARRVAWRQVFRWVQAQCALCDTGMAQMDEIFLPYMQTKAGITFYEQVQRHGANLLAYDKGAA